MAEIQLIPARHGVATFVPGGHSIKIINTSGSQMISVWAFALPSPVNHNKDDEKEKEKYGMGNAKGHGNVNDAKTKKDAELPSQEEAEKRTKFSADEGNESSQTQSNAWSSYVKLPSMSGWSGKEKIEHQRRDGKEKTGRAQKDDKSKESRGWSSCIPTGTAFSSYIPNTASEPVSTFASSHYRDPSKSYLEQLQDFSKTPVGAAGLAAISGSGYGSSLYAGYQAYQNLPKDASAIECMSMSHSHVSMLHLRPRINDTFVSNLGEPMLTLVEDTSSGSHNTLMAACNPQHYRQSNVEKWEEHDSCAENLVLALNELNTRAGLKGSRSVGADVTVDKAPTPLNLFMSAVDGDDLSVSPAKCKAEAFVRLRAERDIVVIMSACPREIDDFELADAQFFVEEMPTKKRMAPKKLRSFQPASTVATGDLVDDNRSCVGTRNIPKQTRRRTSSLRTSVLQAKEKSSMLSLSPNIDKENRRASGQDNSIEKLERKKPRKLSTRPKTKAKP